MVFCAACLALGAQGQNASSDPAAPGSSPAGSPGSAISSPSGSSSSIQSSRERYSATGRTGQHEVRASKLMGTDVKSSSGESLGTISDVILNPASGKVDFAVIALSATLGSTGTENRSATGTAGASTSTLSQSSQPSSPGASTAGKLSAVPWTLLRSSGAVGYGATASSSGEQQSLVFTGEKSKLVGAPSFEESNWPQINGPEWRTSIYSYYDVQPGSSTGAASSPGGVGSSSDSSAPASSIAPSYPNNSTPPSPDSSSSAPEKP